LNELYFLRHQTMDKVQKYNSFNIEVYMSDTNYIKCSLQF